MIVLVSLYDIRESRKKEMAFCTECQEVIPTWELRESGNENPRVAYACGAHVDTVLFNMVYKRIPVPKKRGVSPDV